MSYDESHLLPDVRKYVERGRQLRAKEATMSDYDGGEREMVDETPVEEVEVPASDIEQPDDGDDDTTSHDPV